MVPAPYRLSPNLNHVDQNLGENSAQESELHLAGV